MTDADIKATQEANKVALMASPDRGLAAVAPFFTPLVIDLKTGHSKTEVAPVIELALETDPFFLALRDPQRVETDNRIF